MTGARPILFCSDYGLADEFVGVCHAVMAKIAPQARVIDLAHEVPPQDVARGAMVLGSAAKFGPPDAVFLAIVDPGVGTERRPVVVEAGGASLVGPDNGVLSTAWEELGGAKRAFQISSKEIVLQPPSNTFHGRDVFAPAAAHLAMGIDPAEVGEEIEVDSLVQVEFPGARIEVGYVHCKVIGVDRFGNVQLSARPNDLDEARIGGDAVEVRAGGRGYTLPRRRAFAEVERGKGVVVMDSSGYLTVAINHARAAERMGMRPGDHVVLAASEAPE